VAQPNLIHPVPVELEQIDKSDQATGGATFFDDDFREPVQQVERKVKVQLVGQVMWDHSNELTASKIGAEEDAAGYVLLRFVDLSAKSVVLVQNDRFTKLGKEDTDVYIIKIMPLGHYTDQSGATLVKAFFADRTPVKGVA